MSDSAEHSSLPAPLIAAAGWLVPGAGYFLLGQRARGLTVGIAIVVLYLLGLLIAGVRVIEVPGYDNRGNPIYRNGQWVLTSGGLLSEIANKPWFVGQILAGPLSLVSAAASLAAGRGGFDRPHAPLEAVGTLYTAIAGMLNLLVIIDSTHRAGGGAAPAEGEHT